jgi:hypothetical protein
MQCEITSEMVVQFARDIANAGKNGITEDNKKDLEKKSESLINSLSGFLKQEAVESSPSEFGIKATDCKIDIKLFCSSLKS